MWDSTAFESCCQTDNYALCSKRCAYVYSVSVTKNKIFHIRLNDNQDSEVSDSEELPVISKKLIFFVVFGHAYSINFFMAVFSKPYTSGALNGTANRMLIDPQEPPIKKKKSDSVQGI